MNPALARLWQSAFLRWKATGPRTRHLLGVWAIFAFLVAAKVHGSSIGLFTEQWMPGASPNNRIVDFLARTGVDSDLVRRLVGLVGRPIRSDEWLVDSPWALSQLVHKPSFPEVNWNIGQGQAMLLLHKAPVWHPAALARPVTWGYLAFGAARGLAWQWWFPAFACFTALYLLLEIMLRGQRALAAFGAFWFCSSSYVICWSLTPAYFAFFPAAACVAGYHLVRASGFRTSLVSGVALGFSLSGFVMAVYPAWQVVLGQLFLILFVGLVIRDRDSFQRSWFVQHRVAGLVLATAMVVGIVGSFLWSCWDAIRLMGQTAYPGRRLSTGGDLSFLGLFRGTYNLVTNYRSPLVFGNASEASSFYHLFPAVLVGAVISKRVRQSLGLVGWLLVAYIAILVLYMCVGIPEPLAKVTLLSFVPGSRADLALGLSSILLCTSVLGRLQPSPLLGSCRQERIAFLVGAAAILLLFLSHGIFLRRATDGAVPRWGVLLAAILAASLAYLLFTSRKLLFGSLLASLVVATGVAFNPVSIGLGGLYESPLANEIVRLDRKAASPLWLCYGAGYAGVLVSVLGGRSLSGVHFVPALPIWRALDPEGKSEAVYNRYAHVFLLPSDDPSRVTFASPQADVLQVSVSPENPVLRSIGAKYVLAVGNVFREGHLPGPMIYRSPDGRFSIFDLQP